MGAESRRVNYYNENDPYAAAWLENLMRERHIGAGRVDARNIHDVRLEDVRNAQRAHFFAGIGVWEHALQIAGWPDDRPVWTGSCPCQPFSVAGRGRGIDDERHLWPEWLRLIRECRPSVVFGEQVASADGRTWLDTVRADLEALGYEVGAADLCAAGVGAPHIRQRLYFGARLADAADERLDGRRSGEARDGRDAARIESERLRDARGLADDRGEGRRQVGADGRGGSERSGAKGLDERSLHGGALGGSRGLGDASGTRTGRDAGAGARAQEGATVRAVGDAPLAPGATGGFWSAPDWVYCRDGKYRPVEPGTFPLAHGAPARVGRLRAYGNAIVSEVAATFVKAFMEAM